MTATQKLQLPAAFNDMTEDEPVMEIHYYGFNIWVYWCQITVERASSLLELNTRNRRSKDRQVDRYAYDMAGQTWFWNGSTICLSTGPDRVLLDGQNRLLAVVKSGQPIWSLLLVGLPLAAQDEMDNGTGRSFKDTLAIAGERNSVTLGSLVRSDLNWSSGLHDARHGNKTYSRSQLQKHLDLHPELRDVLNISKPAQKKFGLNPTMANQCALLFHRLNPDDCSDFWKRVATIGGSEDGDPIVALQNALISAQAEKRRGRPMQNRFVMALVIKAWNAYRSGQKIKQLKFQPGGAKPDKYPMPF